MGFDGLVVGDWNAHGQVPGCTNISCPASINAGLDMFMAPDSWKGLYENTLAQARSGEIPAERLNDAVRRILRVKLRAGLFDKPKPSARPLAGRFDLLGSSGHRAVAREAVRKSLVLLKNGGGILPLSPRANVLVAGDGADNISRQAGGWTITWQGSGVSNADFPNAQSIFAGIREAVGAAGGRATLSVDGRYTARPDVAIVVFGEEPYAEFVGDRRSVEYSPADKKDLELLRRLKQAGIPLVSVFLSGRPLWVNPELNASDAFVAAWLPGSEGGGIADVLFRDAAGKVRHDFRGKLTYSWPRRADQTPLNRGDAGYDPLFAYGYGLAYGEPGDLPLLSEERPAGEDLPEGVLFVRGALPQGWRWEAVAPDGGRPPAITSVDRTAPEDARRFARPGGGEGNGSIVAAAPADLSREATGELSLLLDYRVDSPPTEAVSLWMACGDRCGGSVPVAGLLRAAPAGEWRTLVVPLRCFVRAGLDPKAIRTPFALTTGGRLTLAVSGVRIASAVVDQNSCGAP